MAPRHLSPRPPAPCGRRERGFTFVEVLVALLVMAVLSTMAWQGVELIARTQDTTRSNLDRVLRTNTVIAQWEQDLQALQGAPAVQAIAFDGAAIRLTRRTPSGLQLVVWRVSTGQWERWAAAPTLSQAELQEHWMRSQQLTGDEPGTLRALANVSAVQLYFFQRNGWSNAQSTGNLAAPPASAASGAAPQVALPDAVRLVLSVGEHTLTRDTLLWPEP